MNIKELVKLAKEEAGVETPETPVEETPEVEEEKKANEVMNTQATNFGTELIPTNVMADPLLDLVGNYSMLLPLLPWNHGNNMAISEIVPIVWEADLFQGNTEWTTWAWSITPANHGPHTDKVTIVQGQYITTVDVSKRELNYATDRLEAIIRERVNRAAARTIDAVIINGDTATTWNVNGTYDADAYFAQADNGIRKVGIANGATTVWTLAAGSFLDLKWSLGDWYQSDLNNLLFLAPSSTYNKAMLLDEVITIDKFGPNATISTGVLAKVFNIDLLVARDFPALTDSTGKVSETSTDNVYGSLACIYKPAVQYWFGQPLEIEVGRVLGKGIKIVATFEFWFAIANEKALLGKTVALWVGVDLS